ncbi:hypothetical protein CCR94_15255 [Rhodoblastus sphagnicola]|uniref:DUF992 domain-containing protein n=1 Tax=Rhodoblastus sphagnicola TaxID=333368 RepID=A0A2S6N4C8_9HYPH|nr:DUF992 domain-containing protein [Rhodoblastus sphagnicola]MBB4200341.1 hypothetical protein [Rhodoblastus sphagnicola]PPQ29462.1 hypothetical protein CCR94_15255 [Rhodoblastus sphagnicola]
MIPAFKLCGVVVLAALLPATALADGRVGALECHLSGNGPSILVENQSVDCVFASDRGGRPAHYVGKLTKIGANVGANASGDLLWGVVAATSKIGPGALAGEYVGPEASAKVGLGVGAAVLVGGSNQTVSLQPVNVEAGAGLGFTAGVESLTLAYVADQPAPKMRHRHLLRSHHHHSHHG